MRRPSLLRRPLRLAIPALLALLLSAVPVPGDVTSDTASGTASSTVSDARRLLEEQRTETAAQILEKALEEADGTERAELRYLRFKAYILDLRPGVENLFPKITKGEKEPMETYEAFVDGLEADVRAEGEAALPVLVDGLASGDRLDRLLILGILRDLTGEDLPWSRSTGTTGISPVDAARDATLAALEECGEREDESGAKPPYALEDQTVRDPFVETVYAGESGLEFLAATDVTTWAGTAAFALECRTLAGVALGDRARLRANEARLRAPLLERLSDSKRQRARIDAVALLGRLGGCEDLEAVRAAAAEGGEMAEEAGMSAERILRRHGCRN